MTRPISKQRLKRAAVKLLDRCTEDGLVCVEQGVVLKAMRLAIREIGHTYHDSTRYFFTPVFDLHCEGLGIDPDAFRKHLIDCGLLPPQERRMAA